MIKVRNSGQSHDSGTFGFILVTFLSISIILHGLVLFRVFHIYNILFHMKPTILTLIDCRQR